MITGHIKEPSGFAYLPAPLQDAMEYLKHHNIAEHETGHYNLQGGMVLQVMDLTTSSRDVLRPERHRKYIDVQFLAAGGPEVIGWYPDLGIGEVDEDLLDTPRDICFYKYPSSQMVSDIEMQPGNYAVFFPWDLHIPAIAAGKPVPIRKAVIKVALSLCL